MHDRIRPTVTATAVAVAVEATVVVLGTVTPLPELLVWLPACFSVVAAAVACRAAAQAGTGPPRMFWHQMTLVMIIIALAAVSQGADVLTTPPGPALPPVSGRSLGLYLIAGSVVAVAIVRLPNEHRTWRRRITASLDTAIVAVAAFMGAAQYLRWSTVVVPGLPNTWINAGALTISATGLVAVIKVMVTGGGPVPRRVLWCLAAACTLGPVSVLLMVLLRPWPYLNGTAAALPVAGLLFALAAQARNQERRPAAHICPVMHRRDSAIPLVAAVLTAVLLVAAYISTGGLSPFLMAGAAVLLVLVVARQALALTDQVQLLRQLARQATHDPLTRLLNRRAFTAAIEQQSSYAGDRRTVLLLDIDDFAVVNDALGTADGDALLRAYANRLLTLAGAGAVVARLGSDEFGVLVPEADGEALLERVLAAAREPLDVSGYDVLVASSVGVAGGHVDQAADLFRRAEVALRAATAAGGHRAVHHDPGLDQHTGTRVRLAAELRRGLDAGEFHLVYQPIVELDGERMTAVEALIRWTRPDGSSSSPGEFIPVAEETGLIVDLGAWVIDTACAQAGDWYRRHGRNAPTVSLNVSARQLLDPSLPEIVAAALARHGVPPEKLTIELTETAVFGGGPALATVRALSDLGVTIALDDFGTGHSSLSLLRTCPVDVLKIDKSFVDGLNGTPEQEAIVTALAGIAATLRLHTVAEGVEHAVQAARLRELGLRHGQGFHFARPMPADAVEAMISADTPVATIPVVVDGTTSRLATSPNT